ncbi:hypothetical protein [Candidatus Lokiarchaeum ossiferum]|uniref:hypothetical protein n=1 Tax=Candidatus Lokiarchaeum ossiferum TaxID=2951803 RepID=UPI00352C77B1
MKNETNSTIRWIYIIFTILFLLLEFINFYLSYNYLYTPELNIDWKALNDKYEFFYVLYDSRGPNADDQLIYKYNIPRIIVTHIYTAIEIILSLILLVIIPVNTYFVVKKQKETTIKINKALVEERKIYKTIGSVKPLNMIFIKQRLNYFLKYNKKSVISKELAENEGIRKKIIFCLVTLGVILSIWFIIDMDTVYLGEITRYLRSYGGGSYYAHPIVYVFIFRLTISLSGGYCFFHFWQIWKKLHKQINQDFEKSLILKHEGISASND